MWWKNYLFYFNQIFSYIKELTFQLSNYKINFIEFQSKILSYKEFKTPLNYSKSK